MYTYDFEMRHAPTCMFMCGINLTYIIHVHVDMVECILCLKDGRSALHMAIKCGHTETVRVLLQRGADPNQCADDVSDTWIYMYKYMTVFSLYSSTCTSTLTFCALCTYVGSFEVISYYRCTLPFTRVVLLIRLQSSLCYWTMVLIAMLGIK